MFTEATPRDRHELEATRTKRGGDGSSCGGRDSNGGVRSDTDEWETPLTV